MQKDPVVVDPVVPDPVEDANPTVVQKTLKPTSSPRALNPMKGFMPFSGEYPSFPHSMEFFYMPLNEVVKGKGNYDFSSFDRELDAIAKRKHQAVFRFYLHYPGKGHGVPQYLISDGLKMNSYSEYGGGQMPDYTDARLFTALHEFISALGKRYDGDPRVAFIFTGLIGHWGEWHTYPQPQAMPTEERQRAVLKDFDDAFSKTRVLTRKPASYLKGMDIGLHDDSFAFETLPSQSWHFVKQVSDTGLTDTWKTAPIGGELRPEIQLSVWDNPRPSDAESFDECLKQTRASWMIAHQLFANISGSRKDAALKATASLGYDFAVENVKVSKSAMSWSVEMTIINRGSAPFYYDWSPEIGLNGTSSVVAFSGFKLSSVMPGQKAMMKVSVPLKKAETKTLFLRIKNPLSTGLPLRFSNEEQDKDTDGWISLGSY
ncbi:MAG: DUF4832 domain-containing protein [Proteobacteria bacterium]|nr:MAG: DUF4832 domain-containing protein [Pseudomonadota bacterium]